MNKHLARPLALIGVAILLLLVGQILMPGFLSLGQVSNQLKIAAFLGIFGLCQTIVIAAGGQGLDLSVGASATLGGILGAALMQGSNGLTAPALLAAVAAGGLVGIVNGVGIALMRVPPLVATLAIASVVDGGTILGVSIVHPANSASPLLVAIGGWASGGVPNIVIVWAVLGAIAVWLLSASAWGKRLTATGANPLAALLSGNHVTGIRIAAYGLSGALAALAGFLLTGYVGQAFFGLGDPYILTSVVVAVIGGATLAGGRAPYAGVAAAAIMMTVLVSLLTALAIGEAGRQIIFGLVLLGFLALDRMMKGSLRAVILSRFRTPTPIAAASSAPDTSRGG
ncbi:ABC transporter permease [Acidisoma cellulosilytica]|uniref:ABC transporter permease n=1 Tax=Acidisoma cellulosilyticum TaxID=2802395 RepID=A0A964E4D7_9PROT|nr:ABC transporter permease [Acidisoma cellulosilyticum]MCB8881192.1 ABC transporter permease [Acidisoma cellulosilyticum]